MFIVYRLKQNSVARGNNFRHGLFGHDNGGWGKFVPFEDSTGEDLIIGGASPDYVTVGNNATAEHNNQFRSGTVTGH